MYINTAWCINVSVLILCYINLVLSNMIGKNQVKTLDTLVSIM